MKINFQRPESTGKTASLEIVISPNDYNPKLDEQAKKYAKTANVKGFRPGQAPLALVRRMLGNDAKREVVLELLSTNFEKAKKEHNYFVVGEPIMTSKGVDFEKQTEFAFAYEMLVIEGFEPNFENYSFPNYQIIVDDKTIADYITQLREEGSESEDATIEDATSAKVRLTLTQKENTEEAEATEKSYEGEEIISFKSFQTDTAEKLKQLALGESLEGTLEQLFSNLHEAGDILGLDHNDQHNNPNICKVTLLEWKKTKLAELNEEFFASVFPEKDEMNTYENFYDAVVSNLKEEYKRIENFARIRFVKETLAKETNVEFPDELYRNQLTKNLEAAKDLPDSIENILEKEYAIMKQSQIMGLVLSKANEEYKISISYNDVISQAMYRILRQFGLSQMTPEIQEAVEKMARQQLERDNFKEYYAIHDEMLENGILQKIADKYVTGNAEEITFEDLNEKLLSLKN